MTSTEAHDAAIASYWTEQMEAGWEIVQRVWAHPVEESGEPLVDLREGARSAGVELRFSERPHAAGRPRMYIVREPLLQPLLAAAAELRESGHTLLIEDAFRTREMQRDLAVADGVFEPLVTMLRRAEPDAGADVLVRRLAVLVAARPKGAGHMAGAAVDVSVVGPDGRLIDRGGPYPTVSEVMPMASPFVSEQAGANRRFISDLMARHGFVAFPPEFWHYSCDDAFARVVSGDAAPARYGPVDLLPDGGVAPAADQLEPLHPDAELTERLTRLLRAAAAQA